MPDANAEAIRDNLKNGRPVCLTKPIHQPDSESSALRTENIIDAQWLASLSQDDEISVPICIIGGIIVGDLILRHTQFKSEVRFFNCEFRGKIDLTNSTIAGPIILNSTTCVGPVIFDFVTCKGHVILTDPHFQAELSLRHMKVTGSVLLNSSCEQADLTAHLLSHLNCEGIRVGEMISIENTRVIGDTILTGAKITGQLRLVRCVVKSFVANSLQVESAITLDSSTIHEDLSFKHCTCLDFLTITGEVGHTFVVSGNFNLSTTDVRGSCSFKHLAIGKATDLIALKSQHSEITNCEFMGPVTAANLQTKESLLLSGVFFRSQACFIGAYIGKDLLTLNSDGTEPVTFSSSSNWTGLRVEGSIVLSKVKFEGVANFQAAVVLGAFILSEDVQFSSGFDFRVGTVHEYMICYGTRFGQGAQLTGARINRDLTFTLTAGNIPVTIDGPMDARDLNIGGEVSIFGTRFKSIAWFTGSTIGRSLTVQSVPASQVLFADQLDCSNIIVRENITFEGVRCRGPLRAREMKVSGFAKFSSTSDWKMRFEGSADFTRATVLQSLEFLDWLVKGTSTGSIVVQGHSSGKDGDDSFMFKKNCTFDELSVGGTVSMEGVHFSGDASFCQMSIKNSADYSSVHFHSRASFDRAQFAEDVRFQNLRCFGHTSFSLIRAERQLVLCGAEFIQPFNFQDASVRHLVLGRRADSPRGWRVWFARREYDNVQFLISADVRGLKYETITGDIKEFTKKITPFDRQPYVQLEQVLRSRGDDDLANWVYLARRHAERKRNRNSLRIWSYLIETVYSVSSAYGVRPYYLVFHSILILAAGAFVFSQPNALRFKDAQIRPTACDTVWDAIDVSVRSFLPIQVALTEHCVASQAVQFYPVSKGVLVPIRPDWVALLLRLLGTVAIGIGIASLTGFLRRISR